MSINKFSVQEVQDEGKYAIDSPGNPLAPDLPPEEYALGKLKGISYLLEQLYLIYRASFSEENEERSMISPQSYENPRLKELMVVLIEWINDELASQRIIVKDLEEDLYDGQVLHKLIGEFRFNRYTNNEILVFRPTRIRN